MTATSTDTRVDLDEQVQRDLQPPCEIRWAYLLLGRFVVGQTSDPCPDAAEWIVTTTCHCGEPETALMCDGHLRDREIKHGCHVCGCIDNSAHRHVEPIRKKP